MITIYGQKASRAFRAIWLAEEIGLDYELKEVNLFEGEHKSPDYLALNPLGQVPAMADGDFSMGESLAITLYLARKYGGVLGPRSPEEEGQFLQWALWAATSIEPLLMPIIHNCIIMPPEMRNDEEVNAALDALSKPLAVLDSFLADREYLVGDRFTVADLNVAAVLSMLKVADLDVTRFGGAFEEWFGNCLARQACDYDMQRTKVTPEMLARLKKMREAG